MVEVVQVLGQLDIKDIYNHLFLGTVRFQSKEEPQELYQARLTVMLELFLLHMLSLKWLEDMVS